MKKVAIVQSNYIPWKGYFDLIAAVDEFILFDDMQYTRRDWRNRNKIKTPNGLQWLTIPVVVKGKYHQKICDTIIADDKWSFEHWKALEFNYRQAPFFTEVAEWIEPLYRENNESKLSCVNRRFIENICSYLGIETEIKYSWEYSLSEGKTERLVSLCLQSGATHYLSGPSAKNYIEPGLFTSNGITLEWADYSGYVEYPQLWGRFEHGVTIIDLLFNCGSNAKCFMINDNKKN